MIIPLVLELAADPTARERGLMDRRALPGAVDGMVFLFPEVTTTPFTNVRTHLPLDLAFVDSTARIIAIVPMRTIEESGGAIERYDPPGPYIAALEMMRGRLATFGVTPGASLALCPIRDRPYITAMICWSPGR